MKEYENKERRERGRGEGRRMEFMERGAHMSEIYLSHPWVYKWMEKNVNSSFKETLHSNFETFQ